MRFHLGFSKYIKPSKLLYWLGFLFFGLLALLGFTDRVNADTQQSYEIYEYDMVGKWGQMNYNYLTYGSSITSNRVDTTDYCNNGSSVMSSGYCQMYGSTGLTRTRYLTTNARSWNGQGTLCTSNPPTSQNILINESKYMTTVPSLCDSSQFKAMDIIYKVLVATTFGEQNYSFTSGWLWYIYDDLNIPNNSNGVPSTDINEYIGARMTPINPNSQDVMYSQGCYFTKGEIFGANNTSLPLLTASNEYYVVCPNNLINNGTTQLFDRYELTFYNKLINKSDYTDDSKYLIPLRWHTGTSIDYCPNTSRVEGITNGYHSIYYSCQTDYLPPEDQHVGTSSLTSQTNNDGSNVSVYGDMPYNIDFIHLVYPNTFTQFLELPLYLASALVNNHDTCNPITIDFSSLTRRFGGSNYVLTLPCLSQKLQSIFGYQVLPNITMYNLIDMFIAFYLFYLLALRVVKLIDMIISGQDLVGFLYSGTDDSITDVNYDTGEVTERNFKRRRY